MQRKGTNKESSNPFAPSRKPTTTFSTMELLTFSRASVFCSFSFFYSLPVILLGNLLPCASLETPVPSVILPCPSTDSPKPIALVSFTVSISWLVSFPLPLHSRHFLLTRSTVRCLQTTPHLPSSFRCCGRWRQCRFRKRQLRLETRRRTQT